MRHQTPDRPTSFQEKESALSSRNDVGHSITPRIAYLTTEYPKVSHTFIRREIQGLERSGYSILRASIRKAGAVADPQDKAEQEKTVYCLADSLAPVMVRAALELMRSPVSALRALRVTCSMSRRSERGLLRHLAYWLEAAWFAGLLRRHRIDHVHVHFGTNAAAVARLAHLLGGPTYSMTIHGPSEFDAPIGLSLGDKMKDAAFTVAISDFCASQLRRWAQYQEWGKIEIVHCTVGEDWLTAATPIPEHADSIVFVGRLNEQKGPLFLVDAFGLAVERGLKGSLIIVGDGELRDEVEARIDARGLRDRIYVTGWQSESEVREHLLRSRALILPSFAEGLPVVIMEALALGRPVISTYIAGIPELVRPGKCGWLVPAGNVESLCDAIMQAMEETADKLSEMGSIGRKLVEESHLTETEVRKLDALFRRTVSNRS
ncbi:MAG: colanic acid biosynthesis glycosyltransferase WcaL [Candidatus Hydrogenedentota bacterium]